MRRSLFPQGASFYKCNMHCHTVISDGDLTAEEVKAAYVAQGYAAVAFTDHEVMIPHDNLTDEHFIALRGYETAVKERPSETTGYHQHVYHLNLIARAKDNLTQPFVDPVCMTPGNCRNYLDSIQYAEQLSYDNSVEGVCDLIRRANEAGFLVALNHPYWSLIPEAVYAELNGLHAVEISNYACRHHGDCSSSSILPFLRGGKRVFPVGGDDNHNKKGRLDDSFGAFTMLAATEFSYEGLTDAYANGDLYVSEGPEICDITYGEGELQITCSPVCRIILASEGRYVKCRTGEGLTEATFSVAPERCGSYFRLELVGADGRRAYTRAYFFDELAE